MKKGILALLIIGACWGAPLQAQDWGNAPIAEVQKAAKQGDVEAQADLGMMYVTGYRVAKNYKQGSAWLRKAAKQGHTKAQYNLSLMYANGQGVAQNNKLAYVWSSVAATNGYTDAATNRDIFAKRLGSAEMTEAQELAGQYFEQYQPKQ